MDEYTQGGLADKIKTIMTMVLLAGVAITAVIYNARIQDARAKELGKKNYHQYQYLLTLADKDKNSKIEGVEKLLLYERFPYLRIRERWGGTIDNVKPNQLATPEKSEDLENAIIAYERD